MFIFVFLVFLFLHFAFAQYDAVAYAAACIMNHPVSLSPVWTSLLLTLLCFGLISGIRKLFPPRRLGPTAACVATGWLAAAGLSLPFASALWQAGLLIVAVGMVLADRQYNLRLLRLWGPERTLWQKFMPRAIELLVLCLYVGAGTAVSDVEHFELRTAQALRSDHPEEAYHIGEVDLATSPRLFAMRCYLLATHHPKGLGDKLLQQPVPAGGSDNLLLPDDERQRLLLPADSLTRLLGSRPQPGEKAIDYLRRCALQADKARKAKKEADNAAQFRPVPAIDYYLCALLLERHLDRFAQEAARFYPQATANATLPTYYAQAMVYYARQHTQPAVMYHDSAIEANLRDYADMEAKLPDDASRPNLLRRSYGETYWWWYEYGIAGTAQP